jgi:hypothetical protein
VAVCLVFLVLVALFHVADAHSVASDADHCPLCIVMHSVAPVVVLALAILLIRIAAPAPELVEVRAIIRYWHPTLFTRPPPTAS